MLILKLSNDTGKNLHFSYFAKGLIKYIFNLYGNYISYILKLFEKLKRQNVLHHIF